MLNKNLSLTMIFCCELNDMFKIEKIVSGNVNLFTQDAFILPSI